MADKGIFLPGMSATADIETRYRTNVVSVPIQAVTTRLPKGAKEAAAVVTEEEKGQIEYLAGKKARDGAKPMEVVFIKDGTKAKMVPVKRGISDDAYYEILEGLNEGQEVITGSFKAVSKELEDDKEVKLEEPKKKVPEKP
jgi:HlyD family secretion protein